MPVIIFYILYSTLTSATELTFIVVSNEQLCMLIAWVRTVFSNLAVSCVRLASNGEMCPVMYAAPMWCV